MIKKLLKISNSAHMNMKKRKEKFVNFARNRRSP